jgi:S-formylglutathione hydrolase FrmB
MSRGLGGHSMGGYGTVRIGMKRPDVFSSLYIMSACCLLTNPYAQANRGAAPATPAAAPAETRGQQPATGQRGQGRGNGFANVGSAQAAAWASNPDNPPKFFDLPTKDGAVQPLIAAKYIANSPLVMIDQYVTNLKKYHAIMGDVGTQDTLAASNRQMDEVFTSFGIKHTFETYEGDHTNHVKDRFEQKVLPFFSKNLSFSSAKE